MGEILRVLFRRRPFLEKREDRTVKFTLKELIELNPMLLRYPLGPHWLKALIEAHKELAKRREGR